MATIQSTLTLQNKMSSTLSSITKAMHSTLNAMRSVKTENGNMSKALDKATQDIFEADKALTSYTEELDRNAKALKNQKRFYEWFIKHNWNIGWFIFKFTRGSKINWYVR